MATASTTMNSPMALPGGGSESEGSNSTAITTSNTGLRGSDFASGVTRQMVNDPLGMLRDIIKQPTVRKMLPLIIILVVVAAFGLASLSMKAPAYRPLSLMLSESDKMLALEALKAADFSPVVDQNSGQITVPASRYQEAKMLIASKGLPKTEAQGMDGLKDMPAMTTSQFMEQVKYNNAMEQELARSISQIGGIKSARVHLAAPKQSVFVRDRVPTKASVIIQRAPGRSVSSANVQAIIQLVASSVPYLAPENVSVVDNYGTLMNDMLGEQPLGLTGAQLQQKQQIEDLYRTRLIQLLAPIVGEVNVTAQVSLVLDFNQQEITTEDFDVRDKGPKTRSELYVEDRNMLKDAIGIPGSLSNTPPNPPANPAAVGDTSSNPTKGISEKGTQIIARSTKNYELDRSVRHVKSAMGNIQKLGVGVLINERPIPAGTKIEKSADGSAPPTTIPYTQEELDRLNQLVRGAVGFSEERGDVVTVVATRFEPQIDPDFIPWYKDEGVVAIANSLVVALLFLLFLFFVVRPMVRKLTKPEFDPVAIAAAAAEAAAREAAAAERLKAERISEAVALVAAQAAREKLEREEAAEAARLAAEAEAQRIADEAMAAARKLEEEARVAREAAVAAAALAGGTEEVVAQEGESLDDIKARMSAHKPKKPTIPTELLDGANTYEDKVALIRMIFADNSGKVAAVMKSMIKPD